MSLNRRARLARTRFLAGILLLAATARGAPAPCQPSPSGWLAHAGLPAQLSMHEMFCSDHGDAMSWRIVGASHGMASLTDNGNTLVFRPDAPFHGTASVRFQLHAGTRVEAPFDVPVPVSDSPLLALHLTPLEQPWLKAGDNAPLKATADFADASDVPFDAALASLATLQLVDPFADEPGPHAPHALVTNAPARVRGSSDGPAIVQASVRTSHGTVVATSAFNVDGPRTSGAVGPLAAALVVFPASAALAPGDSVQVAVLEPADVGALRRDVHAARPDADRRTRYVSSDPAVASVSPDGLVTARRPGRVQVAVFDRIVQFDWDGKPLRHWIAQAQVQVLVTDARAPARDDVVSVKAVAGDVIADGAGDLLGIPPRALAGDARLRLQHLDPRRAGATPPSGWQAIAAARVDAAMPDTRLPLSLCLKATAGERAATDDVLFVRQGVLAGADGRPRPVAWVVADGRLSADGRACTTTPVTETGVGAPGVYTAWRRTGGPVPSPSLAVHVGAGDALLLQPGNVAISGGHGGSLLRDPRVGALVAEADTREAVSMQRGFVRQGRASLQLVRRDALANRVDGDATRGWIGDAPEDRTAMATLVDTDAALAPLPDHRAYPPPVSPLPALRRLSWDATRRQLTVDIDNAGRGIDGGVLVLQALRADRVPIPLGRWPGNARGPLVQRLPDDLALASVTIQLARQSVDGRVLASGRLMSGSLAGDAPSVTGRVEPALDVGMSLTQAGVRPVAAASAALPEVALAPADAPTSRPVMTVDGTRLFVGGVGAVRVVDAITHRVVDRLAVPDGGRVTALANEGNTLVAASTSANGVRVWLYDIDLANGPIAAPVELAALADVAAHPVLALALTHSGNTLVVARRCAAPARGCTPLEAIAFTARPGASGRLAARRALALPADNAMLDDARLLPGASGEQMLAVLPSGGVSHTWTLALSRAGATIHRLTEDAGWIDEDVVAAQDGTRSLALVAQRSSGATSAFDCAALRAATTRLRVIRNPWAAKPEKLGTTPPWPGGRIAALAMTGQAATVAAQVVSCDASSAVTRTVTWRRPDILALADARAGDLRTLAGLAHDAGTSPGLPSGLAYAPPGIIVTVDGGPWNGNTIVLTGATPTPPREETGHDGEAARCRELLKHPPAPVFTGGDMLPPDPLAGCRRYQRPNAAEVSGPWVALRDGVDWVLPTWRNGRFDVRATADARLLLECKANCADASGGGETLQAQAKGPGPATVRVEPYAGRESWRNASTMSALWLETVVATHDADRAVLKLLRVDDAGRELRDGTLALPLAVDGSPGRLELDNPQALALELREVRCTGGATLSLSAKDTRAALTLTPAKGDAARCDAELLVRDDGGAKIGSVPLFGQVGKAVATPWPDVAAPD